ncbi:MAG TPA: thiamine pyrophosphate-binding protein [Candidatus Omnitrophota bacterium]|nr:thiamine pyrophosphate-binding protein [Candidatus Omnitrophota bacterium]
MKLRVADYVADFIYRQGISDVFMVTGGGMMFLADGVACHRKLRAVFNHHEQACAMAAVSYAKYTNNLGAVIVTTGCGGTNAITGLLDAWQDNTPCIFISGQVKRKETIRNSELKLRQFGVQEVDILSLVAPITKYAVMVNDTSDIAYHLEKAVFLAKTGRPGPVWLDIPLDVQGANLSENSLRHFSKEERMELCENPVVDPNDISGLCKDLARSVRPIVVAGQGVRLSGSLREFGQFIDLNQLPVVVTHLGIDLLPARHPLFIGRIGNKGDRAGNFALQNADLVLVLGSRLSVSSTGHEYQNFARGAKVYVVDIDREEHKKKTVKIDRFIYAHLLNFLAEMLKQKIQRPNAGTWIQQCREWASKWPVCLPEYSKTSGGINLYYFIDLLSKKLKRNATVVTDAGSAAYVAAQGLKLRSGQRFIAPGAQGEMGYTLPGTIGVCFANKNKETIGITGDGSFQMNLQELQTIVQYDLPIKLFVFNNNGYLSIRSTQKKFFNGRLLGTDKSSGISFPDLKKIARAYGIKYYSAKSPKNLESVMLQVLSEKCPVICELMCLEDQEIIPTVASFRRNDGTLVSKPLEDMYPFLSREEFFKNMIVEPLKEGKDA